jgi:phosphoserine aminotransferase
MFDSRIYNFSAGPSALPRDVLETAAAEMMNCGGSGLSVMEMSHRSSAFQRILDDAESDLRDLMGISDRYSVLFLQGGGTLQFAMVPANLMRKSFKADYVLTGMWTKKAAEEARKYGDVRIAATSEPSGFTEIPSVGPDDFRADCDYVYVTGNNTVFGTRWQSYPDTNDIPLVCDLSSGILSERIDVDRFGLIWAGAQKNIGPAGLVIVIVRKDLIGFASPGTPTMMNYKIMDEHGSLYNTPPTYAIYMAGLVFKNLKSLGGVDTAEALNRTKAKRLYDCIDASRMFTAPVSPDDRSRMNVIFKTGDSDIDRQFVEGAEARGLTGLAGHRLAGGMRASLYNAVTAEAVEALVRYIEEFDKLHAGGSHVPHQNL